jgi:hypothetical protein
LIVNEQISKLADWIQGPFSASLLTGAQKSKLAATENNEKEMCKGTDFYQEPQGTDRLKRSPYLKIKPRE